VEGDGAVLWRLLARCDQRVILACAGCCRGVRRSEGGTRRGSGVDDGGRRDAVVAMVGESRYVTKHKLAREVRLRYISIHCSHDKRSQLEQHLDVTMQSGTCERLQAQPSQA
jgi:hypothetical protein